MAIKPLEADVEIISKLGTNPGVDDGLSEEQLKAKFDAAAKIIKDYLNNYLIHQIDSVVDVDALLKNILDTTLSKSDKAANAAATGEAIRGLRSFFEKVVHGGDYVLKSGGCFAAENPSYTTVHINDGVGVICGNLFSMESQDVVLQDGTYGLSRSDLIVVRCTRNDENALTYSFEVLTGENTSGAPVDPECTNSNINSDGTVHDFPLYRIRFDGLDIVELAPLFEAEKALRDYVSENFATKDYASSRYPYNYAHNSDFTQFVAQAGIGGLHGTKAYAGDRWILDSGTVTGDARADGNGYTNITLNGTIRQKIANPPAVGTVGVEMISGTATVTYENGEVTVTSNGGVIGFVKLFPGEYTVDNIPKAQPKGYGAELAECQMYFYRVGGSDYIFIGTGYSYSATQANITVGGCPDMRIAKPTATFSKAYISGNGYSGNASKLITGISSIANYGRICSFVAQVDSGLTIGDPVMVQLRGGYLEFNADL